MLHYARLRLQQRILSPKPTHNYFVTPQCITDSRSQRLQLPRNLHKAKISLTHAYPTTVAIQDSSKQANPMSSSIPIDIYLKTSNDTRLTHGSRTTVANTRFHKKGQTYQKSCQKISFGFPIKSHPIQKKSLYIHGHPNKLPPNGGYKENRMIKFSHVISEMRKITLQTRLS